jgi:hypothetical protein
MATSSIAPPIEYSTTFGTLGHAYVFAQQAILMALEDQLDLHGMGIVSLVGDLQGTGSDTIRVTDYGNVGWNLPMTALASETDTVAASNIDIGYETVTLGQFGLSHSETYKAQVLGREAAIGLDALKMQVPNSWRATFRNQVTLTGSGIATAVGAATTTLSVDDHLDLATAYKLNLGNRRPTAIIDPTQDDQLARSYRNEPAFTNTASEFAAVLGLQANGEGVSQLRPNLGGLGIDFSITDSVVQSGGARQGFAFPQGGIGWAVANTSPIKPANQNAAIYVPQFGLFIEELTEGGAQTTRQYRATTFMGFALGSSRVYTNRRLISII